MVTESKREVSKFTVVCNVRVDGHRLFSLGAKVVQQLGNALLAFGVLPERVDDPNLTSLDSTERYVRLLVTNRMKRRTLQEPRSLCCQG